MTITDEDRFRWMFSGHTTESLKEAHEKNFQPDATIQDRCISDLSLWYHTIETARETIDAYMKQDEEDKRTAVSNG